MNKPNTLRTNVRQSVLDKIQYGELLPGDKIKEAELCENLGYSRTPVREALFQLVSEGVLTNAPHRGFTVSYKSSEEKEDIYVVLGTLDTLAANLAFDFINDSHIKQMSELADMIDVAIKYQNYPEYCRLQQKFHEVYRSECPNAYLRSRLKKMHEGFVPMTYFSEDLNKLFDIFRIVNEEHREIIRLFLSKDKEKLCKFLADTHWVTQYHGMI